MIKFPLTITKSTRLFGGYEYIYLGDTLIKIPISKKADYGSTIKLSNKNNIITNNFNEAEIYLKLIEQKGNKSRRNIYLGLPLFKKDLLNGTNVTIEVMNKSFRVNIPAKSIKKNVLRLKNLVTKLDSNLQGDLFLTLIEKEESREFQKYNSNKSTAKSYQAEIIKDDYTEISEYDTQNIEGIVFEVFSEPSFKFSVILGFPYIIQFKFEKTIGGNKTIKRLN